MQNWSDFFVATAGASAALVGFIFVSVSISLKQILSYPNLPGKTLESLLLPINVLLISCCGLVPDQPLWILGSELLILGLITSMIALRVSWRLLTKTPVRYKRSYRFSLLVTQLIILPSWLAGILIITNGLTAVYWVVPTILLSFIKAIYDAWILIIEINR
ncbi:hypothetical protein IC229_12810 [Spirosoma sp. BT702]|uniref:Modulator of FtsH protease n=1 Tax=Spirosoma profusum TaxID=2771354 RepID=A0A926XVN1_9BACT|nr:hypothetical protein [Spirosoma profusum]MBD2701524.1 hypothetical protein [Spirosoma profusum]